MSGKILVTGSGNCGTTFLMKLFTELRLDTGWTPEEIKEILEKRPRAGLEWPIRGERAERNLPQPRIIKAPHLCFDIRSRIERWDWNVEHVFVLLREWEHVASHKHKQYFGRPGNKLSEKEFREYHEMKAASAIGNLMIPLVEDEIPYTFIMFPRMVTDPLYLHTKLEKGFIDMVPYHTFSDAFGRIADISKVHHG